MTAVLAPNAYVRPVPVARRSMREVASRWAEPAGLFLVVLAGYLYVAYLIGYRYEALPIDSVARADQAASVLYASQPHLAAVGFVWNPLPAISQLPLLLLRGIWPALLARALAAMIMSSLFMAWGVVGLRGILVDRGAGRFSRLGIPLLFAVSPMVVYYGADGMSEAFFTAFLIWTCRSLLRYVATRRSADLIRTGVFLALAYWTRYEAAAVAIGVAVVVVLVGQGGLRRGDRATRRRTGSELLLALGPFAASFVVWAVVSAVVVGTPFAQFSSAYGNTQQVGALRSGIVAITGQGSLHAFSYAGGQLFALEPLLPVIAIAAVYVALQRRSLRPIVPLAVFGSELAFSFLAFLAGDTFGWLRFYLMAVPLAACSLAVLVPVGLHRHATLDEAMAAGMRRGYVGVAVAIALAVAVPTEWHVFGNSSLAREEYSRIHEPVVGSRTLIREYGQDLAVARTLDALPAGRGQVLTEASDSFQVRTLMTHQAVFMDTTDPDFQRDLADPVRFGIRWILVKKPGNLFDAVDATYPTLWSTGGGFGPVAASFPQSSDEWRLYRVTARVTPPTSSTPLG